MQNLKLIDCHQDLLAHLRYRDFYKQNAQTDYAMLEAGNVATTVATAFPVPKNEAWFDASANTLIEADLLAYQTHCACSPNWNIATQPDALDAPESNLLLHIEGLNVFTGTPEDFARLNRWYELGLRSVGIVWNLTNSLGGGTKDGTARLTTLGKAVLAFLAQRRMVIDFAHMNEPTFWSAAEATQGPIYVSHANARALCDSPRNLSDRQLKAVAERDGSVGIMFANRFICADRKATIADVGNHVEHMLDVMGPRHVHLGTDLGGIISGTVDGLENVAGIPELFAELRRRNVPESTLEAIASGNAKRVLGAMMTPL